MRFIFGSFIVLMFSMLSLPKIAADESSQVLQFTVPKLVEEKHDVVITLYHRDGKFNMGYAQLPSRDNIVHRVDVTPV